MYVHYMHFLSVCLPYLELPRRFQWLPISEFRCRLQVEYCFFNFYFFTEEEVLVVVLVVLVVVHIESLHEKKRAKLEPLYHT